MTEQTKQNTDKRAHSQSNPTSRLAGRQKTMLLKKSYKSDILHSYLTEYSGVMFGMYERLGGLKRMLANDQSLSKMVSEWVDANNKISDLQISDMKTHREALLLNTEEEVEEPEFNIPENYHVEVTASHPIVREMLKLVKKVDEELYEYEVLYFIGLIDDTGFNSVRKQALNILSGVTDRIAKATKPGKRKGGQYNPNELAKYIREGNHLTFMDMPQDMREHVSEYENKYEVIDTNSTKSDVDTNKKEKQVA